MPNPTNIVPGDPFSHTHPLADVTDEGALAAKNTIATADIDNDAVTYAKIQNVSVTDRVLGRSSVGAGDVEEITMTSAGRAIVDDADAAAQRTTLGLGAMATKANVAEGDLAFTDITTANASTTQHGLLLKLNNSSTQFLRGDGTWATPTSNAFPIGSVFIAVVATDPATLLGYGTWSAIGAGRVLVGIDTLDTDFDVVEETGGAKTVASAGTNAGEATHTHSVTSNVAVADHASHTHTYTDIVNHTHPVTDPGHSHTERYFPTATGGSTGNTADLSMSGTQTNLTLTTASATTGITTGNPVGGVATGTTAGPSATLTHGVTNNAVTSGAGSSHTHTFTGSATSVVQPYFVVYMWKRTA